MDPHIRMPRVIVFEGVDGAGKSTVLASVAEALRARGRAVHRPRVGKRHRSRPARAIRDLTRDVGNLELCPRAELALYCAREAQVLAESVTPALARGEWVLLDRGLLTPVVLGAWGRGLPLADCEAMATAAGADLRVPTLTLVFDVDPRTARQRKQIAKIRAHGFRDGGRKGLAGSGFKARIRAGYRVLAARDPDLRLLVTERDEPAAVVERVLALLDGAPDEPDRDSLPWWRVGPGDADALDLAAGLDAIPEALAIYLSRRLVQARDRRALGLDREPALSAWALDPDDPARARALAGPHPDYALAGLRGQARSDDDLRWRLAARLPIAVAPTLAGIVGDEADALRRRLVAAIPGFAEPGQRRALAGGVLASLEGREDHFAAELRATLWTESDSFDRAASLRGCVGPLAARLRAELFELDPARALASLRGLPSEAADPYLERYATVAPKPVLRALHGRADASAWALREALSETGSEVVESVVGLADARSHALRQAALDAWPLGVVKSLRGLAPDDREAEACRASLREQSRGDLELRCALLRAEAAAARAQPG